MYSAAVGGHLAAVQDMSGVIHVLLTTALQLMLPAWNAAGRIAAQLCDVSHNRGGCEVNLAELDDAPAAATRQPA